MVDAFRTALESLDGGLHEAPTLDAARALARALIGEAAVARWADGALDGIAMREAPARDADVSLIVADVAVAQSGAIGFAHGPGRPRATGLLPIRQVALLRREDVVADLPAALARLFGGGAPPPANVVFAGGPSRTADIEQRSIRGAHAPRDLDVIVYG